MPVAKKGITIDLGKLSFILAFLIQFTAIVWMASGISSAVTVLRENGKKIDTAIEALERTDARQDAADARQDARLDAIKER